MEKPRHINPPDLKNARKLTNLELNKFKASDDRHTVITPELLAKMTNK